jgi:3-isopropylmalate/(R)-2-methylmalate dehydratase small subunit
VIIEGKVYTFGHDINTDEIIPARYLNTSDPQELARYCMEDSRPGFADQLEKGGIIVAGKNFGCGSSREHAPLAIKAAGVACVVAASFARIFFRNAINIGLPIVESPEAADKVREADTIRIDLIKGVIHLGSGEQLSITPFPPFMQAIVGKGGWMSYLREPSA